MKNYVHLNATSPNYASGGMRRRVFGCRLQSSNRLTRDKIKWKTNFYIAKNSNGWWTWCLVPHWVVDILFAPSTFFFPFFIRLFQISRFAFHLLFFRGKLSRNTYKLCIVNGDVLSLPDKKILWSLCEYNLHT